MQGRVAEAMEDFRSAHRMSPTNEKLAAALAGMEQQARPAPPSPPPRAPTTAPPPPPRRLAPPPPRPPSRALASPQAEQLRAYAEGMANAASELCGTPCQDVIDGSGTAVCSMTWGEGCGDEPPPSGFSAASTVAELCSLSCAYFSIQAAGK